MMFHDHSALGVKKDVPFSAQANHHSHLKEVSLAKAHNHKYLKVTFMGILCEFGRTEVVLSLLHHIMSLETGF